MFVLDIGRINVYEYQSDKADSYIVKMLIYLLISKEAKVLKNLLSLKMSSMKSTGSISLVFLTYKTIFSFRLSFFSLPARHLAFSLLSCWIFLLRR